MPLMHSTQTSVSILDFYSHEGSFENRLQQLGCNFKPTGCIFELYLIIIIITLLLLLLLLFEYRAYYHY